MIVDWCVCVSSYNLVFCFGVYDLLSVDLVDCLCLFWLLFDLDCLLFNILLDLYNSVGYGFSSFYCDFICCVFNWFVVVNCCLTTYCCVVCCTLVFNLLLDFDVDVCLIDCWLLRGFWFGSGCAYLVWVVLVIVGVGWIVRSFAVWLEIVRLIGCLFMVVVVAICYCFGFEFELSVCLLIGIWF